MKQQGLISYFERQMRDMLGQRGNEGDELWDTFATHEPSDDEILRLLSISTVSDRWSDAGFSYPTPFEALVSLPEGERAMICREFRQLLKSGGGYH